MQLIDHINELFAHMKWADAAIWKAVTKVPSSETDKRIKTVLNHIHLVQKAYLSNWKGETVELPRPTDVGSFADIKKQGCEFYDKLQVYMKELKENSLDKTIDIPWSKWFTEKTGKQPYPLTLAESMIQVAMHSGYHRGQVNARIREIGGEPSTVDFLLWVWLGKPKGEW